MKYRVAGIVAVLVMIVFTFVGIALASGPDRLTRYEQHEQNRSVEDLSLAEQEAAFSTSIDPETFASHLPVISIQTNGQTIPGRLLYGEDIITESEAETIPVELALYDNEDETPEVANRLGDTPEFETQAEIHVRGHSSSLFFKSSYRLTFTLEDRVTANPQEVLDMGVEEDWVLHGPYLDKTLLRNYMSYNLFGEILPYTPDVRFVELFINDEYQGVYVLTETVKVGEDRVALRPTDNGATETSFLVSRDWVDNFYENKLNDFLEDTFRVTNTGFGIDYPVERNLTQEQKDWIEDTLNQLEKSVYSYDYDTPDYGYWNILDVDSFIDYALVSELALNMDAGRFSTFLYKDLGGKLAMGPLWDFNNAYDNNFERSVIDTLDFVMLDKPFYSMLFRDEGFTEKYIQRWRELREELFSDERLDAYVDDIVEFLGPAVARNYEVWGQTLDPDWLQVQDENQRLEPLDRNPTTYEEAIADLKEAIKARAAWIDEHIDSLRQFSHESAVKAYNH